MKKLAKAWKELGDNVHAGTSNNSGDEAHQMADGSSSTTADADHEAVAETIRNVISELERVVHVYKQIAAPKPSPRTLSAFIAMNLNRSCRHETFQTNLSTIDGLAIGCHAITSAHAMSSFIHCFGRLFFVMIVR